MKTSTLLLVASLVANGALLAAVVLKSPATAPATAHAGPAAVAIAAPGSAAAAARVPVANLWSRLHGGTLEQFRDRLRAAGFPAKAVRAMLSMAINDEQKERREAIVGKMEDMPYWKIAQPYATDREKQEQMREVYRETGELFYKLVGGPATLAEDEYEQLAAKRRYGNLPLEKLQQLLVLDHDLEQKRMALSAEFSGPGRVPDAEAMRAYREGTEALEKTRSAEVAKLLAPDELEQYELRNSPTSAGLRQQLAAFRPTEAEFKALYAVQKNMPNSPDAFMAQAQAVLGADRYAEFAVTMTSDGRGKLGELIGRLELPLTTITTINGVRDDIRQRAQVIGNDTSLAPTQREAQLAALAQEADQRLTSTLGKRGYEAYADLKGEWIRALKPKKK